MMRQLFNMDRRQPFIVACSGGVDSMAVCDFYKRGNKDFIVGYFHHGTKQADEMREFVRSWCIKNNVRFITGCISNTKSSSQSQEEYWRDERYRWLKSFNLPVITCHHLNDAIETWIFSSLHGNPKVISYQNGIVFRPFIITEKQDMIDWCVKHEINWVEDRSNLDVSFPRNRIRHNIVPEALKINPGLAKVIKKKILASFDKDGLV
jgi:tRNA(Ile)-lysidine synthase